MGTRRDHGGTRIEMIKMKMGRGQGANGERTEAGAGRQASVSGLGARAHPRGPGGYLCASQGPMKIPAAPARRPPRRDVHFIPTGPCPRGLPFSLAPFLLHAAGSSSSPSPPPPYPRIPSSTNWVGCHRAALAFESAACWLPYARASHICFMQIGHRRDARLIHKGKRLHHIAYPTRVRHGCNRLTARRGHHPTS